MNFGSRKGRIVEICQVHQVHSLKFHLGISLKRDFDDLRVGLTIAAIKIHKAEFTLNRSFADQKPQLGCWSLY